MIMSRISKITVYLTECINRDINEISEEILLSLLLPYMKFFFERYKQTALRHSGDTTENEIICS